MIALFEKRIEVRGVYVDLRQFEQHSEWLLAVNPDGHVPVLDHNDQIITHTTVSNAYLEGVFPDVPLRSRDAVGEARMRCRNKFADKQVMNYTSMHGCHRVVGVTTRNVELGEFE